MLFVKYLNTPAATIKRLPFLTVLLFAAVSCEKDAMSSGSSSDCGTHNGKALHRGPDGGCYYYNSSGNKTYVDRSECRC